MQHAKYHHQPTNVPLWNIRNQSMEFNQTVAKEEKEIAKKLVKRQRQTVLFFFLSFFFSSDQIASKLNCKTLLQGCSCKAERKMTKSAIRQMIIKNFNGTEHWATAELQKNTLTSVCVFFLAQYSKVYKALLMLLW